MREGDSAACEPSRLEPSTSPRRKDLRESSPHNSHRRLSARKKALRLSELEVASRREFAAQVEPDLLAAVAQRRHAEAHQRVRTPRLSPRTPLSLSLSLSLGARATARDVSLAGAVRARSPGDSLSEEEEEDEEEEGSPSQSGAVRSSSSEEESALPRRERERADAATWTKGYRCSSISCGSSEPGCVMTYEERHFRERERERVPSSCLFLALRAREPRRERERIHSRSARRTAARATRRRACAFVFRPDEPLSRRISKAHFRLQKAESVCFPRSVRKRGRALGSRRRGLARRRRASRRATSCGAGTRVRNARQTQPGPRVERRERASERAREPSFAIEGAGARARARIEETCCKRRLCVATPSLLTQFLVSCRFSHDECAAL